MTSTTSQLLRLPVECFSYELTGHFEWLALEAYLNFLNDQIEEAQRLFRERAEAEYKKEREKAIKASRGMNEEEYWQNVLVLEHEYKELKEVEERHIPERAWLSFFSMVWSVFEKQFHSALRWAHRRNTGKNLGPLRGNSVTKFEELIRTLNIGEFDTDWRVLHNLYRLRNAIVHVNGYVHELNKEEDREKLFLFIKEQDKDWISINEEGAVIFGSDFAQEAFTVCRHSIERFKGILFSHFCISLEEYET